MLEEEGILKRAFLLQQIRWELEEHGPVRGGPEARSMGALQSWTDETPLYASVSLYFQGFQASEGVRVSRRSGEGIPS